jgi:hypothetical protein
MDEIVGSIDTDNGKRKYGEGDLSQCHAVHNKFDVDSLGIEPRPPR